MITLDQFLELTFHGKKLYYDTSIRPLNFSKNEMPFWMERIQTAIEKSSPLCVSLINIPQLLEFYWDYKNEAFKKQA